MAHVSVNLLAEAEIRKGRVRPGRSTFRSGRVIVEDLQRLSTIVDNRQILIMIEP